MRLLEGLNETALPAREASDQSARRRLQATLALNGLLIRQVDTCYPREAAALQTRVCRPSVSTIKLPGRDAVSALTPPHHIVIIQNGTTRSPTAAAVSYNPGAASYANPSGRQGASRYQSSFHSRASKGANARGKPDGPLRGRGGCEAVGLA